MKAAGINGCSVGRDHPLVDLERLQFGKIEVDDVPMAVWAATVRELCGDVRHLLKNQIVEDDGDIVTGQYDVLFQIVSAHGVRVRFRHQRMFREIARSTAVSDDDRGLSEGIGGSHAERG